MNILKQLFIGVVAMIAVTPSAMAQLKSVDAFTNAPMSVFPLLDKNARLDMVDYVKSGLSTPSQNSLQGRSAITEISPESLTVKMSDSSAAQIAVLKGQKGDIIALISTVATPGLDSSIRFFDSSWQPLDGAAMFTKPGWKEWLTDAGRDNKEEVTMQVPFMLASYFIDTDAGTLTATNNLATFLDEDTYKTLASALRPTLTYKWNGKRFTK